MIDVQTSLKVHKSNLYYIVHIELQNNWYVEQIKRLLIMLIIIPNLVKSVHLS